MFRPIGAPAIAAVVLLFSAANASAQAQTSGNAGWFVPKSGQAAPAAAPSHASRRSMPNAPLPDGQAEGDEGQAQSQAVLPLPPIPASPDIPKGPAPPPSVIGVISVPDVMRLSTAAQEAERVLGARRDKLAQDAQHEQASWRDEQQKLQSQAKTMTSDQIQLRERNLQSRVLSAQRDFRNRNRIIQEAAQVSLGQIERELVQIVRQVAASHGMNLVLHSEQIALHVDGQDITQQVADHLNKVLPKVFIPAEDVDPEVLAKSGTMPTTADEQQGAAQAPAQQPAGAQQPAPPASVLRRN